MSRLDLLVHQIGAARRYTEGLIDNLDPAEWFRMPGGEGVTHVAWQVGHLAFAQYRLALERTRGTRPGDGDLITEGFLKTFGRGSVPVADPSAYPAPGEIRSTFDRVHRRVLDEVAGLTEAMLDEPPAAPHKLCATKAEVLAWCAAHEMFHAGQIALLRRLLGHPPIW
jgi:hypothetical protein